jgi:hypothetical protein
MSSDKNLTPRPHTWRLGTDCPARAGCDYFYDNPTLARAREELAGR